MRSSMLHVGSLSSMILGATVVLFGWCSASAQSTSTTMASCTQCCCVLPADEGLVCRTTGSIKGTKKNCPVTGCLACGATCEAP